jgi:acyl carrier protein
MTDDVLVSEAKIRTHLRCLIAEVTERSPDEITDTMSFADELAIDSLMAMEIVVAVEKKYRIQLPDDELSSIQSVDDAVRIVSQYLAKKGPL